MSGTSEILTVTSELLPSFSLDRLSKPVLDPKNVISKFSFSLPLPKDYKVCTEESSLKVDEDGDLILERQHTKNEEVHVITLELSTSTELSLVGLQIWRGALLLADFIIHNQSLFHEKTVLELGAGVGLTSIVAAIFSKRVICTDIDIGDILSLLKLNTEKNKNLMKGKINVIGLDFFKINNWSDELTNLVKESSIILAADVIYDDDVTEAFVNTLVKILSMSAGKTVYIALEKRYVFTLADLDSVAPCYEYLLDLIKKRKNVKPFSEWTVEQLPIDFPQYFNYERVRQLVMWRISS